jgi:hypothetical protein
VVFERGPSASDASFTAILTAVSEDIDQELEGCLRMTEALLDAMDAAVRATDPKDVWRFASYKQFMRKAQEVIDMANAIEPIRAPVDRWDLDRVPSSTNTIAIQQQELFEAVRANLHVMRAYLLNRVRPKSEQASAIADFLQASLRRAVLQRPERERDVQDTIEQLLIGRGMEKGLDYDREVGRVKASAKEVIPDFVLPQISTAIEVKLLKDVGSVGRVVDEINADIRAYGQDYDAIVFAIYDIAGAIRDEYEFRRDLEAVGGVKVLVIKH